jgi:isopentenyl-diphosphate delta-isomerase
MTTEAVESVVLLDESGRAVGTMAKSEVHHHDTPLHLGVLLLRLRRRGPVLVTRRALHKATFPGVWTNSCCGHPAPGEEIRDAVRRRVAEELGLALVDLRLLLPRFRYRAVMDGVTENEMCPVFVARTTDPVRADPEEVDEVAWEPWAAFRASVLDGTRPVSSWCRDQVRELPADPLGAAEAAYDGLPHAARG